MNRIALPDVALSHLLLPPSKLITASDSSSLQYGVRHKPFKRRVAITGESGVRWT